MKSREYELTISPKGEVELLVKGYKGKRCLEAVRWFEKIVGELKAQRETSEFYEPEEEVRYRIDQKH